MLATIGAIAALANIPLCADGYRFIVNGDVEASSAAGSCTAVSSGVALETGAQTSSSAMNSLEARFRTYDDSEGSALRSDGVRGCLIVFK